MRRIWFLVATLALVATSALSQRPWPPPGLRCHERTLVLYRLEPTGADKMGRLFDHHMAYITSHIKDGAILAAGRTDDGGAVIFSSRNWSEVEQLVNEDPYVRDGVITVASHLVWNVCEADK